MKDRRVMISVGIALALALGGAFAYRFTQLAKRGDANSGKEAAGRGGEVAQQSEDGGKEPLRVRLAPEIQREHGVVVETAKKVSLGGVLVATGKVESNADRTAHVSPAIPGKIVRVEANLGDTVRAGQVLARMESVALGEALSDYRKAQSRSGLAKADMERIRTLVEKKIAARKEILHAETEYGTAMSELHASEERLALYGLPPAEFKKHEEDKRILLPVHSPINGVMTEKHATVGELADPSMNLFTVADLSSVWVVVDVNEKDLGRIGRGRPAAVKVGAFPESVFRGRITYVADLVDEVTRTVKARIEVANPGRKLKPGMFATAELEIPASAPPVLAVREEAIVELDGKKVLFITGDGAEFLAREVAVGARGGAFVEITAGVAEGDRYAASGGFLLKSELKKSELGEE